MSGSATASASAHVCVIGGGLGGLAAACVLGARGHRVTLFESNGWWGGKAAVLQVDGFRFDMGPTILTVPRVLARIFAEAGEDVSNNLDLIRLDPQWRCFFDDGSRIDLHADVRTMVDEIGRASADPTLGEGYRQFQRVAARLSDVAERFFFWKPVEDFTDTLDLRTTLNLSTLRDILALRMGQTVAGTIRAHVKDARLAQMLDHMVQYVGSNPYGAPAVLCAIANMQAADGVWYPKGGTGAVAEALVRLARRCGVELRSGRSVVGLMRRTPGAVGSVCGVVLDDGSQVPADAVVSNMDSVRTYADLVGDKPARHYTRRHEPACSGVVLYLGLRRRYEHLQHHGFVFSADPEAEFDMIYRRGEPAPDPTCYIAAPAITDPSVAPAGGEALYVLVHTPYLRDHHDWTRLFPAYRRTILDKLKRTAGLVDIDERIQVERHLTPQDIHDRYRVWRGAIYGLASHGTFRGAFKPGNRSRHVPGLYLAGGAAHPGPGMPMVLMSGWIAADALDGDVRAGAVSVLQPPEVERRAS